MNINVFFFEGIYGFGVIDNSGVFGDVGLGGEVDEFLSVSSEFGGMYIDGFMLDVLVEWIENLWDEMGDVEDKMDRDIVKFLLEVLKDGDMGELV